MQVQMLSAPELSRCFIKAMGELTGAPRALQGSAMPPKPPDWAVELAAECSRQAVIAFCEKNGLTYPGVR